MKSTGQALGGGQWILRTNGHIGHPVIFPSGGRYQIRVQARGELAGSASPMMQIRLDGRVLGNFPVGNTSYQYFTYTSPSTASAGSHLLQIGYMNDSGNRSLVLFNTDVSLVNAVPTPVCGNNIRETGEGCDDGNQITEACAYGQTSCTVCGSSCQTVAGAVAYCGDSAVNGPEVCDNGSQNGQPNRCNSQCTGMTAAVCGNAIIEAGEQCDDGNASSNDGCSSSCQTELPPQPVCGNGTVESGEQCDDGNTSNNDGCSSSCQIELPPEPVCGNGTVESGEACDDGNTANGDGCSSACAREQAGITPVCGNGIIESGEQCDDLSNDCTDRCTVASDGRAYYACDCGVGAEAGCLPGNDSSGNGSEANPWRSYDRLQDAYASSACGTQFYFCQGGSFSVTGSVQWAATNPRDCSGNPRVIGAYDTESFDQKPLIRTTNSIRAFDLGTFGVTGLAGIRVQDLRMVCTDPNASCNSGNAAGIALANGISEVMLDNLTVEGFNMGFHATPFEQDPSFILRQSDVRDSTSFGILGEVGDDTHITDNLFDNNAHCILNPPAGQSGRCGFIRPVYVTPTGHSGFVFARNTLTNSSLTEDTGQCNDNAVHVRGGDGALIEDNTVITNADRAPLPLCGGFRVYGHTDGQLHECRDCVFRRNRVYNTSYGVHMGSWVGGVVENNVIALTNASGADQTGNAMGAIVLESRQGAEDSTSTGVTIRNNSLYLEDRGAPAIGIRISTSEGSGYRIVSNAIHLASSNSSSSCLYFDSAAIVSHVETEDHNVCYAGSGGEYVRNAGSPQTLAAWRSATSHGDNSQETLFRFRAPDMPTYDLTSTEPALLDRGHPTLSSDVDILDTNRPQGPAPDVGAFEMVD